MLKNVIRKKWSFKLGIHRELSMGRPFHCLKRSKGEFPLALGVAALHFFRQIQILLDKSFLIFYFVS